MLQSSINRPAPEAAQPQRVTLEQLAPPERLYIAIAQLRPPVIIQGAIVAVGELVKLATFATTAEHFQPILLGLRRMKTVAAYFATVGNLASENDADYMAKYGEFLSVAVKAAKASIAEATEREKAAAPSAPDAAASPTATPPAASTASQAPAAQNLPAAEGVPPAAEAPTQPASQSPPQSATPAPGLEAGQTSAATPQPKTAGARKNP